MFLFVFTLMGSSRASILVVMVFMVAGVAEN